MSADETDDEDDLVERWTDPEMLLDESGLGVEMPKAAVFDVSPPTVGDDDAEAEDTEAGEAEANEEREALEAALADIDDELLSAFVVTVLLIKIAVLLVGIGVILVGMAGRTTLGGILIAAGCLAGLRAAKRYSDAQSITRDTDDTLGEQKG